MESRQMTPEEMRLDMLVAELDYENRLLRGIVTGKQIGRAHV